MGLGDDRRLGLLIKIRNEVYKVAPKLGHVEAGIAAQAILTAIGRDPLGTMDECPTPSCACWACVLQLHSDVLRHQAQMGVRREAEQEVD